MENKDETIIRKCKMKLGNMQVATVNNHLFITKLVKRKKPCVFTTMTASFNLSLNIEYCRRYQPNPSHNRKTMILPGTNVV